MSDITEHGRSMVAYNHWANERVLSAASGLDSASTTQARHTLSHVVGTQLYWSGNWTGAQRSQPPGDLPLEELQALFRDSDAELGEYAAKLSDGEWNRRSAWWKQWGVDAEATVGQTLFQVIFHGIHHRAEVAAMLTQEGRSPGDLDYLVYLAALSAHVD